MHCFNDAVALRVVCCCGHGFNPSFTQQVLKGRTDEFLTLVMYHTHGPWVMQQPSIFEGSCTLLGGLCYDQSDLQEIGHVVYHCKSKRVCCRLHRNSVIQGPMQSVATSDHGTD